jgi:nucleotide-binding universal stress UspA family protein
LTAAVRALSHVSASDAQLRHDPTLVRGHDLSHARAFRSGPDRHDATRASEHALLEAAVLLGARPALVVVVWKAGLAFELIELPASSIGLPPAPLEIRTALDVDRALYEGARRAARQAAELARSLGMDAEPLTVAEDPDITVAETLLSVTRERDAQAMVIGAHAPELSPPAEVNRRRGSSPAIGGLLPHP